jgi:uncharacterized membrane protein
MNIVTEKIKEIQEKDRPHQNVRVTEIKLSLDNMVVLVFKFMIASLIVGVFIGAIVFLITGLTVFSF